MHIYVSGRPQKCITWNVFSLVRIVKSVNVASFLICQKFSAWLVENVSVRGKGIASAAAMSKTHNYKVKATDILKDLYLY